MSQERVSLLDRVDQGLLALTAVMLAFIVGLTLVQVFFRYVLNNALGWSAELTKIVFIWMTFLGSAVAVNRGRHLRIDTFVNLLKERHRIFVDLLVHILAIVLLVVLVRRGFELSLRAIRTLTGALRWPRTVIFLPVPLGSAFMILFALRVVKDDIIALVNNREKK